MDARLKDEIENELRDAGHLVDEKVLEECVSICKNYNMEPETLRYKIEAANYRPSATTSQIIPITMDTLSAVRTQLKQDMTKGMKKAQVKVGGLNTAVVDRTKLNPSFGGRVFPGVGLQKLAAPVKQEAQGDPMIWSSTSTTSSNVTFTGPRTDPEARKKRAYRYMFEKISERSESLDQLIDDFADLIRAHYDISDFGDPAATTDEEVTIVGRITHDTDAAEMSKLVEGAIMIESSRMLSTGTRASLVLDPTIKIRGAVKGCAGIGIYPGAIVALKGRNGGGGYFLATEVLAIPPLKPSPAALKIENPKLDPSASQSAASMFVVCGPYTSDADTSYKPWRALLNQIKAQKPDVLLLSGPFIDCAHPKIKAGDIDLSPANLFRAHFIDPIKAFLTASPGSIVIMVPSVRDLTSTHAAFPQPEFDIDALSSDPRIHLLPNPARFTINDISFGITSVDTLFHLRKEEYFKRGIEVDPLPATPDDLPTDTMANLCRHLLLQRSFYPIFPPPQDLSAEVNLDMSHFDEARLVDDGDLDYAPDVLILPSRLKQFSKVVHSTTAINPSFLSKGTYGKITLEPRSVGTPKERLKVDIARLEVPPAATVATTSG
ncbi:hypothetical protein D9613_005990 [Agrocybe pediades]|uniref:DNA polymerase alpha subunit B n=1 Tax=Agrocybe pediades TaxID=84607 RepID=A0A8H4QTL7_9AGAR|nr:hypothetical protein D9613_005990 [Agrocybe pediades]